MKIAESRITAQGQVSVPVEVRRRLGLVPGSTIEWDEDASLVVVRRARRHTSEDVHHVLFPDAAPAARSLAQLKQGIRERMRRRARR